MYRAVNRLQVGAWAVELHVKLLAFRQIDMVDPYLLAQLETVLAAVRRSQQLLRSLGDSDFLHQRVFMLRAGVQPQLDSRQRALFAQVVLAVAHAGAGWISAALRQL
ncbi:Uncharacterised protein [Klebsiella michiganensis]|uniref:Uncharacterized protein n=1 Tax=Klebsiella michiganensis TaxID=1134687 RepID=A0A7H4PHD5_9ENTR|nr:Uncharacterised protein [Klebsiella michiganensis]